MNKKCFKRWTPFLLALLSMGFYYLSLPPVEFAYFVLAVPILWFFLIDEDYSALGLTAKQFYRSLFAASLAFWGAAIIWLPTPHPAIWLGWLALSAYMALYFPFFIAVSRVLIRWRHFPAALAPAIAWIGTEWLRKHIIGGFSFCSLEHALYLKPLWIQTADLIGEYGVGGLIVLEGTLWGMAIRSFFGKRGENRNRAFFKGFASITAALCLVGGAGLYGTASLARLAKAESALKDASSDSASGEAPSSSVKIALLQDNTYLFYPVTDEMNRQVHRRYWNLTQRAVQENPDLDLIVWPEGTFTYPIYEIAPDAKIPGYEGFSADERAAQIDKILTGQKETLDSWVQSLGVPVLFGCGSAVYDADGMASYNSALYWPLDGESKRYDKRHRVMFGEYIPLLENLPDWVPIKTLCVPIAAGKRFGDLPIGRGRTALVTICYESSVPDLIRFQRRHLEGEGKKIDLLLSVSNDAWFCGGSENELHLATYVFRAVENRLPFLAATHGGTSLAINPVGKIIKSGTKGKSEVVTVEADFPTMTVPWDGYGFYIPQICALFLLFPAACGWRKYRKALRALRSEQKKPQSEDSSAASSSV